MQLSSSVHLVGSGLRGMRLTHLYDCNVFLLDGGSDAALIDAGSGMEPQRIIERIEETGAAGRLSTLLLTHAHGDHAAGARFWHERGLKVLCAQEAKPWLESADQQKFSLDVARERGVYPADFQFPPCPISRGLRDGEKLQIGEVELEVLETPGHARGHLSFLFEENGARSLFGGDIIFSGGTIVPQVTWDFSTMEYSASLERLHSLGIEVLYPGHASPLLAEARIDIKKARDLFFNFQLPPTLP